MYGKHNIKTTCLKHVSRVLSPAS